jgi:hypothetical protein
MPDLAIIPRSVNLSPSCELFKTLIRQTVKGIMPTDAPAILQGAIPRIFSCRPDFEIPSGIRGPSFLAEFDDKMAKRSDGKKMDTQKLSSAISNGYFFATLSFCLPLGCGRRPHWVFRVFRGHSRIRQCESHCLDPAGNWEPR